MFLSHYLKYFFIFMCMAWQSYSLPMALSEILNPEQPSQTQFLFTHNKEQGLCGFCTMKYTTSHEAYHWEYLYKKILKYIEQDMEKNNSLASKEALFILFKIIEELIDNRYCGPNSKIHVKITKIPEPKTIQTLGIQETCPFCDTQEIKSPSTHRKKDLKKHLRCHYKIILCKFLQAAQVNLELFSYLKQAYESDIMSKKKRWTKTCNVDFTNLMNAQKWTVSQTSLKRKIDFQDDSVSKKMKTNENLSDTVSN